VVEVVGLVDNLQTLMDLVVRVVEQDTMLPLVAVARTQDLQEQQIRDMLVVIQLIQVTVAAVVAAALVELDQITLLIIKVVMEVLV
tara:strand:- start:347 stop:604 length:258 start_codon:yes stop_codon:yes gene_type:complete